MRVPHRRGGCDDGGAAARKQLAPTLTEYDVDFTYAGQVYSAASGVTGSKLEQSLGLAVDNMEATGALSSDALTASDILAGLYDGATVDLYWVNWSDPTMGITIASGNLGELKRQGVTFQAEFRSLANRSTRRSAPPTSVCARPEAVTLDFGDHATSPKPPAAVADQRPLR